MVSFSPIQQMTVAAMALMSLAAPAFSESKKITISKEVNTENALLLKRGYGQLCVGLYNPAIDTLTKLTRLEKDNLTARRYLTYGLLQVGQITEALNNLKVLTQSPNPTALDYYLLGEAHLQIGWIGAAELDFKKALALKPDMQNASVGLIKVMVCNSDFEAALKRCRECLAKSDKLVPPNSKLSDYYKRLQEAIQLTQTQNGNNMELPNILKEGPSPIQEPPTPA